MNHLLAGTMGSLVGYAVHAVIGDSVSMMTDFLVTSVSSGVVYVAGFVWLRKVRGE